MSLLKFCGICCACLSIWGVIQLTLMGVFFTLETPILIHDAEEENEKDYNTFIKKTTKNYAANAINCWIAAAAYGVTLILSCCCVRVASVKENRENVLKSNDEIVCAPKESPQPIEISSALKKFKKTKDAPKKAEKIGLEKSLEVPVEELPKKT